jgi:DNA mismatch endonuclease (patch repair protein)
MPLFEAHDRLVMGMVDVFSPEKRSWVMARVRGGDTAPEKRVRSFLHAEGFRFRLHRKTLPGRPDIVLPRHRTVVLVNGCFWHGHQKCRKGTNRPTSNREFWAKKIAANIARDRKNESQLRREGWRVLTVWECDVGQVERLRHALRPLLKEHLKQ